MSCNEGEVVRIRGSRARVKEKASEVVCKEELAGVVCCCERVGKRINVTIQVPIEEAPRFTAFMFPPRGHVSSPDFLFSSSVSTSYMIETSKRPTINQFTNAHSLPRPTVIDVLEATRLNLQVNSSGA